MRVLFAALILSCLPVSTFALSCMPHSVEAAFKQAQTDAATFVVVQGRIDFDSAQVPAKRSRADPDPETTVINATLTGFSLSDEGFRTPYNKPVQVVLDCFGPWCANVQRGGQVLAFVQTGGGGRTISTNPCGGYLFDNPTLKMIRAARTCFSGGACIP
jgi:hypothetical protein